jgi:sec-independent protein translocase protein TatC
MAEPRPRPRAVSDDDAAEKPTGREAELEAGRMPFVEHLRELRDRVRNAAIAFAGAFVLCWVFADQIYDWIKQPLFHAWKTNGKILGPDATLVFGSVTEPFWVYMSVALWAGIFVASPFIFNQLWKFIAPGLYKRERKFGVIFAVASALFFASGALFCYYFVLEQLYAFLLGYAGAELHPMLSMREYLDFTRSMMLAFGGVFELPVLIFFLSLAGIVTHRGLWKFNRWFVVIAFVIGAILTPSPDVVSQLLMALPMIVLYNLSILVAYAVVKKRERAQAELEKSDRADD